VAIEPPADLWMLVPGPVVEDHMNALAGGNLTLFRLEGASELQMAISLLD
jgi:hypothetical protein